MKIVSRCSIANLLLSFLIFESTYTQWSTDPHVNNPISTAAGVQFRPVAISDGKGGAIIVWADVSHISAQRIDNSGLIRWSVDGVVVSPPGFNHVITSDGGGGVIVAWSSSGDIYAQRIDSAGIVLWAPDGVTICTAPEVQFFPAIIGDGIGGAIISWEDTRSGSGVRDIYAQRVSGDGTTSWSTNGVAISQASGFQYNHSIVSDGAGGAIIVWQDSRSGSSDDIYAQRISDSGVVQWAVDGVPICTAKQYQEYPKVVSDEVNGAIVTWQDSRDSSTKDIYAQRIAGNGAVSWIGDGVLVSDAPNNQWYPMISGDGAGGAIVVWTDERPGVFVTDIYAQRIDSNGQAIWALNGVPVSTAPGAQASPVIVGNSDSGAVIAWIQQFVFGDYIDIFAQRIDGAGIVQWATHNAISIATGDQLYPTITSDGSDGAIIAWQDYRTDFLNPDIYAQRINHQGNLGTVGIDRNPDSQASMFRLEQNYPNPFNPTTRIEYEIRSRVFVSLKVFDMLGREVATLVNAHVEPGTYNSIFDASDLSSGIYVYRLRAGDFQQTRKLVLMR